MPFLSVHRTKSKLLMIRVSPWLPSRFLELYALRPNSFLQCIAVFPVF